MPDVFVAVTVIAFWPSNNVIPDADQDVVPEQAPEPPLSLDHETV